MPTAHARPPASFEEYAAAFPPAARTILRKVRRTIRDAAPAAEETISYRMPAFFLGGALVYFAAFKSHIGLYPPVRNAGLRRAAARYAGANGNLRFVLDEPIPYALIGRIVKARVRENRERAAARRASKRSARTYDGRAKA